MPKKYEYTLILKLEPNKSVNFTLKEVSEIKTALEEYNPCLNISLNTLRNILSEKKKYKTNNYNFKNIDLLRKEVKTNNIQTIIST